MQNYLLLSLLLLASPGWAANLGEARDLLARGQADAAWNLLAPAENAEGGDAEFDYLLGLAALDSGRPAAAVTAFERLLAVNPAHHGARMELARAYYALGADGLARQEFQQLQAMSPPPQARHAIEQYLRALASREQGRGPQHRAWMEAGLGYDSNITAVTDDFSSAAAQTYGISGLQPSAGNARPREDMAHILQAGWNWRSAVSTWMQDAEVSISYRGYTDYSAYASTSLAGSTGLAWRQGNHFVRAGLSALASWQETEQTSGTDRITNDRHLLGTSLQWRMDLSPATQAALQMQYSLTRYADVPVNDSNQLLLQTTLTQMLGQQGLLMGSGYFSQDAARNSLPNGQDYGRSTMGARLLGQWQLQPSLALFSLLHISERRDDDENSRASRPGTGRDILREASLGASWQFKPLWSLRAQYNYSRNRSNFDLYEFRRHESSLVLRRDFR